ncbi:DUF6973 domain-containing protein [Nocardia fluminea]|uniref:DUF6973 domain-containing protein n=1 Tax=Nocardia fluminea TaxID=134984 RepID=UPI003D0C4604
MTGITPLTVPQVIEWKMSHLEQAVVQMTNCTTILETEANSFENKVARSADYYKGAAGEAARIRAQADRSRIIATSMVLAEVSTKTSSLVGDINAGIATIKAGIDSAEASRWDLFVQDNGTVRSRKSNAETAKDYWPGGAAAILAKEFETSQLSDSITSALQAIERADREGAQSVATFLENLPDAVKNAMANSLETGDSKLDSILRDYQTDKTESGSRLWPTGAELALIRTVDSDFNPSVMTEEEIASMQDLLLRPDGPAAVYDYVKITEAASDRAKELYPDSELEGQGDAFRHTYWNALMTQRFGEEWTTEFTTAHEKSGSNIAQREAMDLFNNSRGREIGLANPDASPEELRQIIQSEISNGTLVVVETKDANGTDHAPKLAYSNIDQGRTGQLPGVGLPLPGK